MEHPQAGFAEQVRSLPRTFYVANTMEIFERMAWYGMFTPLALYLTDKRARGGLELEMVPGFGEIRPCEETGETFEENAVLKARYYGRQVDGLLFAEDSGLEVEALGGEPGVRSARWSGLGDAANNALLVERLRGVADRRARYACVIALARDGEVVRIFRRTVAGEILSTARGSGGFGYDPLFYCAEMGRTFAELPMEEKNRISHRGRAFLGLVEYLENQVKSQKSKVKSQK